MNIYLRITSSKLAAYFIILCSALYGFIYKDGTIMMAGFGLGAGMFANKQYQDRKELLNSNKHE